MTRRHIVITAILLGLAAAVWADDETTGIVPTADGNGVAVCRSISFGDISELPGKALKGIWALAVCITQPIHPYHYVRDNNGEVVKNKDGANKKVWLPFYRIWGEHQGDSVVGIVYDNRSATGIAGSHWLAGYGDKGWRDKGGKLAGLALLAWGASEAFDSDHGLHQDQGAEARPEPIVTINRHDEDEAEHISAPATTPPTEPESPEPVEPVWPPEWEGEGGPVGR